MVRRNPRLTAGLYYGPGGLGASAPAAPAPAVGVLTVVRFDVPRATRFDRIGSEVTTLTAGCTLRWVIYADNGRSYPGALLLDTGAVGDAGSAGWKEATIAQVLREYPCWLGMVPQGTSGASFRHHANSSSRLIGSPAAGTAGGSVTSGSGVHLGYSASGVTGAAPATFPAPGSVTAGLVNAAPQVLLRQA